jgi:hypothetical protein
LYFFAIEKLPFLAVCWAHADHAHAFRSERHEHDDRNASGKAPHRDQPVAFAGNDHGSLEELFIEISEVKTAVFGDVGKPLRFVPSYLHRIFCNYNLIRRQWCQTAGCIARRANVPQPVMLDLTPKSAISMRHPVPKRGVGQRRKRGAGAVDARVLRDGQQSSGRPSRVVLAPRRWCQVRNTQVLRAMVANKPGTPGRARSNRKTIAQGMPA